jgi:hypothetical protein
LGITALAGKLELSFADFFQFHATLDKGLNLGKNGVKVEVPLVLFVVFSNNTGGDLINLTPFFATLDGILQVLHAFLDIPVQHVGNIDLLLTTFDNFIGNLV